MNQVVIGTTETTSVFIVQNISVFNESFSCLESFATLDGFLVLEGAINIKMISEIAPLTNIKIFLAI